MARLPRLALAGHAHLVRLAALRGERLVRDDIDCRAFLDALRESCAEHRVDVHAYALQDDVVHLLLRPQQAPGLSLALQGLGRRYAAPFNRRHGRSGRLWDGRFRAAIVQPGACELEALVFVDHSGAEPAPPGAAAQWHWSSARHHLGLAREPWLCDSAPYWQLGNTPFERETVYRGLLDEGLSARRDAALADACRKGWAIGTAEFLAALQAQLGRPVQPRRRGRPPTRAAGAPAAGPVSDRLRVK